jgi:predicted HicB family RNase H-like nuclease
VSRAARTRPKTAGVEVCATAQDGAAAPAQPLQQPEQPLITTSAGRRRRAQIYGERTKVVIRVGTTLSDRLNACCAVEHVSTNRFATHIIEIALAKKNPAADALKRVGTRGEPRVQLTLRLPLDIHRRLTAYTLQNDGTLNAFVVGLLGRR